MLLDLAITPDVFTEAGYSSSDRCSDCLRQLRPILIEEAVIRDLRAGEWSAHVSNPENPCPSAGRELFEALIKEGRLRLIASALPVKPERPIEWCWEALATHERKHSPDLLDGFWLGLKRLPKQIVQGSLVLPNECTKRCGGNGEAHQSLYAAPPPITVSTWQGFCR